MEKVTLSYSVTLVALLQKHGITNEVSKADEAKRIIKTAAKLIKHVIKNHAHETDFYPTVYDIKNTENEFVPLALQTFNKELVKSPVKQNYLSQAIFAASRPRTVMPLLFGLAVAADNRMSSKWLNNRQIMLK